MNSFLSFSFRDSAGKVDLEGITSRRAGEGKGEFAASLPPAAGALIPPTGISPGDKPMSSEYG